jgi:hypothetical protein
MGFKLNVDLETSSGPSQEVYVRIESLVVNRVTAKARFQLTYWLDQDHAIKTNRQYVEEEVRPLVGLIQERILYYENEESDGVEILLPHMIEEDMATETEVEVPVFEEKEIAKEVPYTSFDENGDEITLYRTVTSKQNVKVGTNIESRKVIDIKLAENIFEFGYSRIRKMLETKFPSDKIEII